MPNGGARPDVAQTHRHRPATDATATGDQRHPLPHKVRLPLAPAPNIDSALQDGLSYLSKVEQGRHYGLDSRPSARTCQRRGRSAVSADPGYHGQLDSPLRRNGR